MLTAISDHQTISVGGVGNDHPLSRASTTLAARRLVRRVYATAEDPVRPVDPVCCDAVSYDGDSPRREPVV